MSNIGNQELGDIILGSLGEEESITAGYGQAQAKLNAFDVSRHGQAQAQIKQTYPLCFEQESGEGGLLGDFILGEDSLGESGEGLETVCIGPFGQAQARIKQTYPLCIGGEGGALLGDFILGETLLGEEESQGICEGPFGQAQAKIESGVFTAGHGQAQGKINAFDVNKHGQSQAQIKQTYNVHGQSQGNIKQVYNQHGQAQARILQVYNKHGQAQGTIITDSFYYLVDTFTRVETPGITGTPDIGPDWEDRNPGDNYGVVNGTSLRLNMNGSTPYIWIESPINQSDVDFTGEFRYEGTNPFSTLEIDARTNTITDQTWVIVIRVSATVWRLFTTSGFSDSSAFTINLDTTYAWHLQVDGEFARFNVWDASESEPIGWMIERAGATTESAVDSVGMYAQGQFPYDTILYFDNISATSVYTTRTQKKIAQAQAFIHRSYAVAQAQATIHQTIWNGQAQAFIFTGFYTKQGQAEAYIYPQYIHFLDTFSRVISLTTSGVASLGPPDVGSYEYFFADNPGVSSSGNRLEFQTDDSFDSLDLWARDIQATQTTISVDIYSDDYENNAYYQLWVNEFIGNQWAYASLNFGFLELDTSETTQISTPFVPVDGVSYRWVVYVTPTQVKTKIWEIGTTEPDWMLTESITGLLVNEVEWYVEAGNTGADPLIAFDNLSIVSPEPPIHSQIGQARAFIFTTRRYAHGLARARILATVNRHGQARARIRLNAGHAQARARIIRVDQNKHGQAQASLHTPGRAHGQSQGTIVTTTPNAQSASWIEDTYRVIGQANATIGLMARRKQAQAQAFIKGSPNKSGNSQAYIYRPEAYGQAQAYLGVLIINSGQAQARILGKITKSGQAKAQIKKASTRSGTVQAFIGTFTPTTRRVHAQSQAYILLYGRNYGNARAVIVKPTQIGQTQAKILAFGQRATGLSRAFIRRTDTYTTSGQTKAQIRRNDPVGQAQALIFGGRYLVKYNGYHLPGYAQIESIDSITRVHISDPTYIDGPYGEYTGLDNKIISLQMKVIGDTYLDVKTQAQTAATIIRSSRGWAKLYVQFYDRYYLALNKTINTEKIVGESMRTLDYSMEFEAKPWLFGDDIHTITGSGIISTDQVSRTYTNGGWTPANIILSGTNITVSGYTESGEFTGFVSVSGTVTNMLINSEEYTATINGVNSNDRMYNPNYMIFVGPGKTYFAINGATSCTIIYQDRWHL